MVSIWAGIEQKISHAVGQSFELKEHAGISGGSINQACRIDGQIKTAEGFKAASYFVKFNHKNSLDMFEAEAAGLAEMQQSQAIRIPAVICNGIEANQSYLVLEYLRLAGGQNGSANRLGQQLAALHKHSSKQFGWSRNNTIGSTKQLNESTDNWLDFWREQRLGFQLELAKQNGASHSLYIKGEKLLEELEQFFIGYEAEASLLHGDLWSGNYGYLENGAPVIFDPAVYYGDRETDIAMTELFGGFPAEFYAAYNEAWPLHQGYQQRKHLYNLYHVLNHFNLFGGGYAMQAESMLDHLI